MAEPPEIIDLIGRFREHEAAYMAAAYNETSLRDDFLDPFFAALGWDLNNSSGYAQAYRDVIKEESLRTSEGVKAPDFTFRIGGVRKFFVEAKRPSVQLATAAAPAYQLRRYAWSAKLPLSILTNFREFAVYDTRIRPEKDDKASKGRVFYCGFDKLEDNWEWLKAIFAKEAILKGSFDKYVDDNRAKRGTAEVDEDFLASIEVWRDELAHNLAIRNCGLTEHELNFAVQRMLDRIIFLRICEDRGIETYGTLQGAIKRSGVYAALCNLFVAADAKYNSGIFHFRKEKGRDEAPDQISLNLKVDDKVLKSIITSLYYPAGPYEFSVISADILGQVYEQFIGKVIRLTTGHKAVVEDKPAVRKAGGIYYTPSYIVDFMVSRTLNPLLAGKTPRQLTKLRVLDPACGSGSYLISAYQHLLNWYFEFYTNNESEKWSKGSQARLVKTPTGLRLTLSERRRILLTNIFGVDIDDQAVDVTKLSLLLKVLEGETEQTIQPFLSVFQERALPDLETNIKCGNSLIAPDFYQEDQLALDDVALEKINVFDWRGKSGFPQIMRNGKFDVVIGNPPYIFVRDNLTNAETDYFTRRYRLTWDKHNTYLLFMELLLELIADKGAGAYIVPNSWLTIESGKRLRGAYIDRLTALTDLNYPVFNKVAMEPCIFFLAGKPIKGAIEVLRASSRPEFVTAVPSSVDRERWRGNADRITISQSESVASVLGVLRANAGQIGDRFDVRTGLQAYEKGKGTPSQTQADVDDHVFDRDRKTDAQTHAYLQGKDVHRFGLAWSGMWMRYGPWLSQPRDMEMFTRPRVLLREITAAPPYSLLSCFTDETYLSNKSVLTILHEKDDSAELKALAAVLNSKLMTFFYKGYGVKGERKLFPKVVIRNLREFPYPKTPARAAISNLAVLYDRLVLTRSKVAATRTPHAKEAASRQLDAYQDQLDAAVFTLFGATQEDRDTIETVLESVDR
jgi:TaqI-like C-terminal specificity domain/N-6 DNA Methylase/Eco57I restriction-modification methylase